MDLLETADKDLPLRDDIRLLGRILGDTVRSQEGESVFAIVEHIRRNSIRFHRDEDEAARHDASRTSPFLFLIVANHTAASFRSRHTARRGYAGRE
jgi:phosphoenolpyruvate carboxylase